MRHELMSRIARNNNKRRKTQQSNAARNQENAATGWSILHWLQFATLIIRPSFVIVTVWTRAPSQVSAEWRVVNLILWNGKRGGAENNEGSNDVRCHHSALMRSHWSSDYSDSVHIMPASAFQLQTCFHQIDTFATTRRTKQRKGAELHHRNSKRIKQFSFVSGRITNNETNGTISQSCKTWTIEDFERARLSPYARTIETECEQTLGKHNAYQADLRQMVIVSVCVTKYSASLFRLVFLRSTLFATRKHEITQKNSDKTTTNLEIMMEKKRTETTLSVAHLKMPSDYERENKTRHETHIVSSVSRKTVIRSKYLSTPAFSLLFRIKTFFM